MIESKDSGTPWFEYAPLAQKGSLRLFCFPYAGGSTQEFRLWKSQLPPQISLCLVHLPGRERRIREPLISNLQELIQNLADHIFLDPQIPYAFFGHSMGTSVSFELARELRRRKQPEPVHLFVAGRTAPQWPRVDHAIFRLPHDQFIAEIRKLHDTPPEFLENNELVEMLIPILRADFELIGTYQYLPERPLSCPITAYGGLRDEKVSAIGLQAWKEQTSSAFRARMFPGGHFFIQNRSFIGAFMQDLAAVVNMVLAPKSDGTTSHLR
jgi:medium-chain acyl-[acyl-carrier-protein] hydrolase